MEDWLEKGELKNIEDEMVLNAGFIISQVYWGQQIAHEYSWFPRGRVYQTL